MNQIHDQRTKPVLLSSPSPLTPGPAMESHASPAQTGFTIIHANRADMLQSLVVTWLAAHPLPHPLDPEVFLVQSQGMAQWLKHALAANDGCGIAAACDFVLPSAFLWQAYRTVLGEEAVPQASAFDKAQLGWHLYALLPGWLDDPVFEPLRGFLEHDPDGRKRHQLASQLADLFDQYQVYRADWLHDWTQGLDRISRRGQVQAIPPAQAWQPELWRRLGAALADAADTHRAAVHQRFLQTLAESGVRPAGLPERVVVFGISTLPQQTLEALNALGRHCHILMAVQNPCRHYWGDIVEDRQLLRQQQTRHARRAGMPDELDDADLHQHAHPLLAAWGRQGRDMIGLLYDYDRWQDYRHRFAGLASTAASLNEIDLFDSEPPPAGAPLLTQVQWAVTDLEPPPASPAGRRVLGTRDDSIAFHIAHSPLREVEILHDQLLAMFADPDLALAPRDVMVMVPDVASYAPFVDAVFGSIKFDDPRHIPYTIADQSGRASEPLLRALETLLHLPDARLTVSELLDLLDVPAFRRRYGLDEAGVHRLRPWIEGSGVRWGLSGEHRRVLGLGGFEANSWLFGLRRMLLGYAVGDAGEWQGIQPYDEIGGLDAALAGQLADCVATLARYWEELARPATPAQWQQRVNALLDDTLLARGEHEAMLLEQMQAALDGWLEHCGNAGLMDEPLPLAVVREVLLANLDETGASLRFLAGCVNFGTLMPMRAIPFKAICLLGMNDGDYPRSQTAPDFDLMAGDMRPGDRSRREDDRYLLLEALLSAQQRLYISHVGRSAQDDRHRPPSVLIDQLRDYLASGWVGHGCAPDDADGGDKLLEQLTTRHPLQPFSPRYFNDHDHADGTPVRRLFTYAGEWRDAHLGHEAAADSAELPAPEWNGELDLATLTGFLRQPVRHFYSQRLKVRFEDMDEVDDCEPFALDHLSAWSLQSALLDAVRDAGDEADFARQWQAAAHRLQGEGRLPVGRQGERQLAHWREPLVKVWQHWRTALADWPQEGDALTLDWQDEIDGQPVRLRAALGPLRANGDKLAVLELRPGVVVGNGYALKLHHLCRLWPRHLLASACGRPVRSVLVSENEQAVVLPPLAQSDAAARLRELVHAWRTGLRRPLPVACKTAAAWLRELEMPKKTEPESREALAVEAARKAYEGEEFAGGGEAREVIELARSHPDFAALAQAGFADWADRLYRPLFTLALAGLIAAAQAAAPNADTEAQPDAHS